MHLPDLSSGFQSGTRQAPGGKLSVPRVRTFSPFVRASQIASNTRSTVSFVTSLFSPSHRPSNRQFRTCFMASLPGILHNSHGSVQINWYHAASRNAIFVLGSPVARSRLLGPHCTGYSEPVPITGPLPPVCCSNVVPRPPNGGPRPFGGRVFASRRRLRGSRCSLALPLAAPERSSSRNVGRTPDLQSSRVEASGLEGASVGLRGESSSRHGAAFRHGSTIRRQTPTSSMPSPTPSSRRTARTRPSGSRAGAVQRLSAVSRAGGS